MSELTKFEEQILLSVWNLQDQAYGISIYEHIRRITKKKLAIGGIYFPLERLVEKRLLKARKGEPTPVRGGQSKRYYKLTKLGYEILLESREIQDAFWKGLPKLSFIVEEKS
jgi:DNA-binding PadR family transcriptional regulator